MLYSFFLITRDKSYVELRLIYLGLAILFALLANSKGDSLLDKELILFSVTFLSLSLLSEF